ncbi:hypothetical protein EI94DRAFT_639978 [Lactarius quietus]|nr:hypothetical protein EI94DRAFT_639978 [Lactarius quietus]
MPSPPPHKFWASADDWRPGFVMLGANVDAIPTSPPLPPVIIGVDGLWGAYEWTVYPQPYHPEFPYLAWIPLRSSNAAIPSNVLLTQSVDKSMWRAHPGHSNLHVVDPTLLGKFTREWTSFKVTVQDPFQNISSDPSFSSVRIPTEAYVRAFAALNRLGKEFGAWRDFVEVFRNLQRSLLELHAFLDWWKDVRAGNTFRPPIRAPTRGAIFEDAQLYRNYARWSVGAYLLVPRSVFVLDPTKEVPLSPRKLCKVRPMSLQPLLHSLELWYYPPLINDIVMDLETTARGYAIRLDTLNPTKEFKRKLKKTENRKNDEAGRRAKRAKMNEISLVANANNQELRRLTDAGPAPDWFPVIQEVWTHAMNHANHSDLASLESPRRFALPPVHLFWGVEPHNQRVHYHHYLLLFNEIKNRPERDLPALTTQEWRFILGNTYWKKQWPKPDADNPSTFDPSAFWKYGGVLLFGEQRSADVAAGRYDPTSRLACRCDIQLTTADDTDIRQVVLYYLNSFHVHEEIREMERIQFPANFEKRWKGQLLTLHQIVEMWDRSGGGVNSDFSCNKDWRNWVRAVRDLIADWDGFERWDWGQFSNVRNMGINNLAAPEFYKFTVCLLAFFIQSFVRHLGYYPSPLLRPPTLAGPTCVDHRKKFGNGLMNYPIPVAHSFF